MVDSLACGLSEGFIFLESVEFDGSVALLEVVGKSITSLASEFIKVFFVLIFKDFLIYKIYIKN